MRLRVNDYGFDSQLPDNEEESVIENSEKMFAILSDAIYKDKPLAVIRELSCNARDAMYDANKKNQPFKIKFPTLLDPTFMVEDDGIGIHPSEMRNIYLTYGRSSKTEDDNTIGALGLGSKSPFAYTKSSFIVKSRWYSPPSNDPKDPEITEYTFFIFINGKGKPALSLVGTQGVPGAQKGITVEFAVKPEDFSIFKTKARKFFKYWKDIPPTFVNCDPCEIINNDINKVIDGGSWYLENRDSSYDFRGAIAVMGNVPYPIIIDSISNFPDDLKVIAKNSFIIEFPLGDLTFAPSREDLSYDEFTRKSLISRLTAIKNDLATTVKKQIFAKGQSHIEFRYNFSTTILKFINTLRKETYNGKDPYKWCVEFIFDSNTNVMYDKATFVINDLINNKASYTYDSYIDFDIISTDVRGKSGRVYVKQLGLINATPLEDIDHNTVYPKARITNYSPPKIKKNTLHQFLWVSKLYVTSNNHALLKYAFSNEEKFKITTSYSLNITSPKAKIIINDEGGVGEVKFKALIKSGDYEGDIFFIRHRDKEISHADISKKVAKLIEDANLKGTKVVLSSNVVDHREPIVRVKPEKGTIKLNYHFVEHRYGSSKKVQINFTSYHGKESTYIKYLCAPMVIPKYTNQLKIFKLDELINSPLPWLYALKNRSTKVFFDAPRVPSIFLKEHHEKVIASFELGFLQDTMHEEIEVLNNIKARQHQILILNESQKDFLIKKGVKLVSAREHIARKLNETLLTFNFIKDIEEKTVIKKVRYVNNIYASLDKKSINDIIKGDGLFNKLIKDVDSSVSNKHDVNYSGLLMHLYLFFVNNPVRPDFSKAEKLNDELSDQYPIFKLINFDRVCDENVEYLLEYINSRNQTKSLQVD